jgi:hypothetical protein
MVLAVPSSTVAKMVLKVTYLALVVTTNCGGGHMVEETF